MEMYFPMDTTAPGVKKGVFRNETTHQYDEELRQDLMDDRNERANIVCEEKPNEIAARHLREELWFPETSKSTRAPGKPVTYLSQWGVMTVIEVHTDLGEVLHVNDEGVVLLIPPGKDVTRFAWMHEGGHGSGFLRFFIREHDKEEDEQKARERRMIDEEIERQDAEYEKEKERNREACGMFAVFSACLFLVYWFFLLLIHSFVD